MSNVCLLILVLLPFLGAFVTYLVGRKNKGLRDYVADAIVILEFLIAVYVFAIVFNKQIEPKSPPFSASEPS